MLFDQSDDNDDECGPRGTHGVLVGSASGTTGLVAVSPTPMVAAETAASSHSRKLWPFSSGWPARIKQTSSELYHHTQAAISWTS